MGRALRTRIRIAEIEKTLFVSVFDQRRKRIALGLFVRESLIDIASHEAIPLAYTHTIGITQIERAIIGELHARRRVIHHGSAIAIGAGGEVVGKPERVAYLMRRKLAQARERHVERIQHGIQLG